MRSYDLTIEAENDLREIVRYTLRQWGEAQVRRYQAVLIDKIEEIAGGAVSPRSFSKNLPQVFVARCEHHYIFYTTRNRPKPLVLAIFHERQDMVARMADRLGE